MSHAPGSPGLGLEDLAAIDAIARPGDEHLARYYPGESGTRQPAHTAYVPADQVGSGIVAEWGRRACETLDEFAPDPESLAGATGLAPVDVAAVWDWLRGKLVTEPVEDLRIDLEDGYGRRPDDEEDADVVRAVGAVARDVADSAGPPFWGLRFASFEAGTRSRGLRTLDLAIGAALDVGALPSGFVVTLPKVTTVDQVLAMVEACERLETAYRLPGGSLRFEVQAETPQAVLGPDGTATVARIVHAGSGRLSGLHYGTYDYSAAVGVPAAFQSMEHPAADHARAVMQVAAAGTGVRLSDGSTNVLPVGDAGHVHAAWRLHARLVRRSLERGFYQGWDLHPGQLVTRHLATGVFFREGLDHACSRLRDYRQRRAGGVLDEPATARPLASFVLRGLDCGVVTEAEVAAGTGQDLRALRVLAGRVRH